jgi:hypothetical protein
MSTVGSHLSNSFNRASKRLPITARARSSARTVTPAVNLAKVIIGALIIIAGILTFDFLILWITSGKFIERLPI